MMFCKNNLDTFLSYNERLKESKQKFMGDTDPSDSELLRGAGSAT